MISLVLHLLCFISISQSSDTQIPRYDVNEPERLALPNEIPYQISLKTLNANFPFCGGALITKEFVITAAHCVYDREARDIIVVAGITGSFRDYLLNNTMHIGLEIIIHKHYDADILLNDIALIKVDEFTETDNIRTIPIWSANSTDEVNTTIYSSGNITGKDQVPKRVNKQPFDGAHAIVSGYGRFNSSYGDFDHLHVATMFIINKTNCRKSYKPIMNFWLLNVTSHITNVKHICVHDLNHRRKNYIIESGSPLVIDGKLIGIASLGPKYAVAMVLPAIFTFVPAYTSWIAKSIAKSKKAHDFQ